MRYERVTFKRCFYAMPGWYALICGRWTRRRRAENTGRWAANINCPHRLVA